MNSPAACLLCETAERLQMQCARRLHPDGPPPRTQSWHVLDASCAHGSLRQVPFAMQIAVPERRGRWPKDTDLEPGERILAGRPEA